jgi:predicted DNA-binding transcriptional regulator AlpA
MVLPEMGRQVKPEDILDARAVAKIIGLAHRNSTYTYRARLGDRFPPPMDTPHHWSLMWRRSDVEAWVEERRIRREGQPSGG